MNRLLLFVSALFVFTSTALYAQPANDNCSGAIEIMYAVDEASAVQVDGDTRGATGDAAVPNVCSGSWFQDDVWFRFTTPAELPDIGVTVRAYFDQATNGDDVPAVGMAIYPDCGEETTPFACFSTDDPAQNSIGLGNACLEPGTEYLVRVWSGGSPTDFSGTFRIAAFSTPADRVDNVLWEETFANGLDGWFTEGSCAVADSNANATWKYLPDGLLDQGNFIFAGFGLNSPTLCDGAVGVDSDFDDNNGTGDFGAGPCPAPGQYILVSPALYSAEWNVAGITATWTQAIRQFQSTYFISFRTNSDGMWSDWRDFQINQEFETNANAVNDDVQRIFLGGAADGDSLQIRFVYNANYYMWGIDDVRLVETEAHNMRSQSNFYAISPAYNVPVGQERDFIGLNDIYNAGAVDQTNVNLNLTVVDTLGNEIYNDNLGYGTIMADSLAENINFMTPVSYAGNAATEYIGTYTVTSDSCTEDNDFDFSDNQNSFRFRTNTDGAYELENGVTGSFNINTTLYDDGAPFSYAWGIYAYFPKGSDHDVEYVEWGISNPDSIPGQTINILLLKWTDLDQNQIAQANEREIVGFASVLVNGDEGDGARWETQLENFNAPGDPITLEDNAHYLVMFEYNAQDQTAVFLNASEDFDYSAVALSSEQAWENGEVESPIYAGVLGFSPDGNIQGIDYEVTEFGDDGRVFFGFDIVPAIKLFVTDPVSTEELLDDGNVVSVFPNPANRQVNVQLELLEAYDDMQIQIMDMTGKMIESRQLDVARTQTINIDVTQYSAGAYIMKLDTEAGSRTTRFVVQH